MCIRDRCTHFTDLFEINDQPNYGRDNDEPGTQNRARSRFEASSRLNHKREVDGMVSSSFFSV